MKVVACDSKDKQSHGGIGVTSFASMMRQVFVGGKAGCKSVVNTGFMTGTAQDYARDHLVVFAQAVVITYVLTLLCVCVLCCARLALMYLNLAALTNLIALYFT